MQRSSAPGESGNDMPGKKAIMGIKNHKIAAQLKLQPVFPVCRTALEEWKRSARFNTYRIGADNDDAKNWLDADLFKRAIIALLETAAKKSGTCSEIVFGVKSEKSVSCCISIAYALTEEKTGRYADSLNAVPDWETVEIVSQHRGKIEIIDEKRTGRFCVHLPGVRSGTAEKQG
jgi:hypothetical protein